MKKIFLLLGFILLNATLFSQDSCVIKLNLGDCRFCYGPLSKLNTTNDSLKKTIIVTRLDSDIADTFLKDELGVKFSYALIGTDTMYQAISTNQQSEIILYNGKNIIYKDLLKRFNGNLTTSPSSIEQVAEMASDSLKISSRLTTKYSDSKVIMLDYVTSNYIVFDISSKKLIKILHINSFKPESFFDLFNIVSLSRSNYEQNISALQAYGIGHLRPFSNDFLIFQDKLFSNVLLSVPQYVDSTNSMVINEEMLLLISSLNQDSIIPVPYKQIVANVLPDFKLQFCGGPFVFSNDSIFFIFSSPSIPEKLIIAKFKYDKDLKYSGYYTIPFPEYYGQEATRDYEFFSWLFSFPYLLTMKSNEVYNISLKNCQYFPFRTDKVNERNDIFSMDYTNKIIDSFLVKNKLIVLNQRRVNNSLSYYYCVYEIPSMKLSLCKEINLTNDFQFQSFNFINDTSIIGFSNNGKICKISLQE